MICVAIAAGYVTTVAGAYETAQYVDGYGTVVRLEVPTGIALDSSQENIYFTDSNYVRKLALSTGRMRMRYLLCWRQKYLFVGYVGTVASPPMSASVSSDYLALAVTPNGNIYVTQHALILMVDQTFAGLFVICNIFFFLRNGQHHGYILQKLQSLLEVALMDMWMVIAFLPR